MFHHDIEIAFEPQVDYPTRVDLAGMLEKRVGQGCDEIVACIGGGRRIVLHCMRYDEEIGAESQDCLRLATEGALKEALPAGGFAVKAAA